VLWNLIKNAVKFTPSGGVVRIVTGDVPRSPGDAEDRLFIEIRDTGIGIKPEALPKIFNAFEQADRSITRRFGGLGLGLAICRALVQLHGGRISAHSAGQGQGSVFRVELPVTAPTPATSQQPSAKGDDAQRAAVSILLVEDHRDTARIMQRLLQNRGYTVHAAMNVADALAIAGRETIHLLISDIGLPDGTGLELIQKLSAQGPVRGIALSGFGMEEDVERSRAAGFVEHLTKPINMAQLLEAIERVLEFSPATESQ